MLRLTCLFAALVVVGCTADPTPSVRLITPQRLVTSEDGQTATIRIVLTEQPDSNVSFSVSSDDTDEGTVEPSEIVFTPENWDVPQDVVATGVDEPAAAQNKNDGPREFDIDFGTAVSDDDRFRGLRPTSLTMTNLDNDVAIEIIELVEMGSNQGWTITEGGGPLTLGISLIDEPYETVKLGLNLYFHGTAAPPITQPNAQQPEGDLNVSFSETSAIHSLSIDITPENYSDVHEVQIFPQLDGATEDPDKRFDLAIGASGDLAYQKHLNDLIINETIPFEIGNVDPDGVDVILNPTPLRVCTNMPLAGSVRLSQEPDNSGTVEVTLTPSDPDAIVVTPSVVTLSAANMELPFTLQVNSDGGGADAGEEFILTMEVTAADSPFNLLLNQPEEFPITVLEGGTMMPAPINVEQQFCR